MSSDGSSFTIPKDSPERSIVPDPPFQKDIIKVLIPCPWCKLNSEVEMSNVEYLNLTRDRMDPSKALPGRDPDTWELFITGTCVSCWNEMFDGSGDNDDDD